MVLFDTNILVSAALLRGSRADHCVRAALAQRMPLIFSNATWRELEEVLMRAKFDRYISQEARREFLKIWESSAIFVPDAQLIELVRDCRDPDDNKFLELALATNTRAIVSGDPDLLLLDPWRGIRIVDLKHFDRIVLPLLQTPS